MVRLTKSIPCIDRRDNSAISSDNTGRQDKGWSNQHNHKAVIHENNTGRQPADDDNREENHDRQQNIHSH